MATVHCRASIGGDRNIGDAAPQRQNHRAVPVADLKSDLGRNGAAIAVARLVAALTSLMALPLVIRDLGLAKFGLWEAMVALASLSTLITDSAGGTLLWKMSLAWGEGNEHALRRLVRLGIAGSLVLPLLLVPAAALIRSSVTKLFGVGPADSSTVQWVFVVLVASVVFSGVNGTLGALNASLQRVRVTSLAQTVGQIAMYAVCVGCLRMGFDLPSMVIGTVAGHLVTGAILVVGARAVGREFPGTNAFRPGRAHMPTLKYFGMLGAGTGAAFLRGQTDRLILASLASPIWAGYYSIGARLSFLLMEVSNLLYVPTIAASGALMGANNWSGVRSLYRSTMTIVSLVAGAVGLVLIGLSGPLVYLWVGTAVPEAPTILRILAAGTLVAVVITGPGTAICKGIGRPEIELRYIAVSLLMNIILTVGLVLTIGPIGTVIASSVSWGLGGLYFAVAVHRALKLPRVPTRRAGATLLAAGAVATLVAAGVGLLPAPACRRDALLVITVCTPLAIAVLLALSGRIGGVGQREAERVASGAWRRMVAGRQ